MDEQCSSLQKKCFCVDFDTLRTTTSRPYQPLILGLCKPQATLQKTHLHRTFRQINVYKITISITYYPAVYCQKKGVAKFNNFATPVFMFIYFYLLLFPREFCSLSTTSCAPPSTILTEDTRVSLALSCNSEIESAPQLHIVERTFARVIARLSWR